MKGSTKAIFGEILSTFVSTVDDHKQIRATVLWDGKSLMADARDGYTLLAGKGRVEPWTWPVKDEAMIFRSTMGVDNYCNAVGDEPPDAKMFDFKRMQPCAVLYDMTAFSDPQVRKTLAGKSVALFTTIYVKETSSPVMSVGDDISEHTINSEGDKSPAKKLHMLHFIAIPLKTRPGMVREQQIDVYDTSSIVLGVNTWAPKGHPSKKTMPAEGKFMKNQKQPCVDQEIPPLTMLAYATDTLRVMRGSVKEYAKYKGSEIYTRMRNVLVKSEYFEHLRNEHLYCEREFVLEDMSDFEETMRSQPERVMTAMTKLLVQNTSWSTRKGLIQAHTTSSAVLQTTDKKYARAVSNMFDNFLMPLLTGYQQMKHEALFKKDQHSKYIKGLEDKTNMLLVSFAKDHTPSIMPDVPKTGREWQNEIKAAGAKAAGGAAPKSSKGKGKKDDGNDGDGDGDGAVADAGQRPSRKASAGSTVKPSPAKEPAASNKKSKKEMKEPAATKPKEEKPDAPSQELARLFKLGAKRQLTDVEQAMLTAAMKVSVKEEPPAEGSPQVGVAAAAKMAPPLKPSPSSSSKSKSSFSTVETSMLREQLDAANNAIKELKAEVQAADDASSALREEIAKMSLKHTTVVDALRSELTDEKVARAELTGKIELMKELQTFTKSSADASMTLALEKERTEREKYAHRVLKEKK